MGQGHAHPTPTVRPEPVERQFARAPTRLFLLARDHRKQFSPGQRLAIPGKAVIAGLLVNKHLSPQAQTRILVGRLIEQPGADHMLARRFQAIEEMRTAIPAKRPLRPFRRAVDGHPVRPVDHHIGPAINLDKRPTTPAPAHPAMTGIDMAGGVIGGDGDGTAEAVALAVGGWGGGHGGASCCGGGYLPSMTGLVVFSELLQGPNEKIANGPNFGQQNSLIFDLLPIFVRYLWKISKFKLLF